MDYFKKLNLLGLFFALVFSLSGYSSDSGIEGPEYTVILEELKLLSDENIEAEYVEYGESQLHKQALVLLKISDPSFQAHNLARSAVLITGATHGNEYLNIVDRFPKRFLNSLKNEDSSLAQYIQNGGVLYVVPVVNPDGFNADSRYNGRRIDLNRDFSLERIDHEGFREKETRYLAEYIDREVVAENLSLDLTMDYHCCHGSLLFAWAYDMDLDLAADDLKRHEDIARLMQKHVSKEYIFGSTGAVLGYEPVGTSKDYYYDTYGALAFTFEGKRNVEDQNLEKHLKWWESIFDYLLQDIAQEAKLAS